jgi:dienelactone hydrolase
MRAGQRVASPRPPTLRVPKSSCYGLRVNMGAVMKRAQLGIFTGIIVACLGLASCQLLGSQTYNDARKDFKTHLVQQKRAGEPIIKAPPAVFSTVSYDAPQGKMAAYLTPDPKDGKKHPAIIWITGGDCNTIGDVWSAAPANNDQTAGQYRNAGIVMMFPSLRGGNENPGFKEGFLGEVDDVLAAAEYLRAQPYVDPERIYLGGHSTGGTLVLLVAAATDKFRAVFSFGPVEEASAYGDRYAPFDKQNRREWELRAPILWLSSIKSPVFVMEGVRGNVSSLLTMMQRSNNPKAAFLMIRGADHFQGLAPSNKLIAEKILRDTGPATNLTLTEGELSLEKK